MAQINPQNPQSSEETLPQQIEKKVTRKLKAQQEPRNLWFGISLFGMVGWSVMIPTLIGIALGIWIDQHFPSQYSWTLMLLVGGLTLGCFNAWYWIKKEGHF
jgi:ATP synthase protein I